MTERDFCFWLDGFLEMVEPKDGAPIEIVRERLLEVTRHGEPAQFDPGKLVVGETLDRGTMLKREGII